MPHIASGSFGVVYKGKVVDLPDIVVVIKDQENRDQQAFIAWRQEVEFMRQNRSPYVAEIFAYAISGPQLSIIMEYFQNGDLFSVIHKHPQQHPLTLHQRLVMARHCALGLSILHVNRIMHRDVKSLNILVTNDYSCKLTDFGCATTLGLNTHASRVHRQTKEVGSPLWMAPEVRDTENYSFPGDIYSLGVVLYEIFESTLPQYDAQQRSVQIPTQFNSRNLVLPCLNIVASSRPNAPELIGALDLMIDLPAYVVADQQEEFWEIEFFKRSVQFEETLRKLQIVVLVDRSGSMQSVCEDTSGFNHKRGMFGNKWTRWDEAFQAAKNLAHALFEYDMDGIIPLYFFGNDVVSSQSKDAGEMLIRFRANVPTNEGTNLLEALQRAFADTLNDSDIILYVILTDGRPDSGTQDAVLNLIRDRAVRSDPTGDRVNLLFLRVGDDPDAIAFLQHLDNCKEIGKNVDTQSVRAISAMGPKNLILNGIFEHLDGVYPGF
jgi:serine/threonine protein kinase